MSYLLLLAYSILGGMWRREFGSCIIFGKTALKALALIFFIPFLLIMPLEQWYCSLGIFLSIYALVMVFFTMSFYPGGKFTDDKEVLLKYGPFGLGYVLAHKWWDDRWNNWYINGADPAGEVFLGASVFACVGIVWFYI